MRTIAIILAIALSYTVNAEESVVDLDNLIKHLGAEEFDEREAASEKMAKLPAGFAKTLLHMAMTTKDAEISWRLCKAAKTIFDEKIITKTESWLILHGYLGVSIGHVVRNNYLYDANRYWESTEDHEKRMKAQGRTEQDEDHLDIFIDNLDDGPATEAMRQRDIIVLINGEPPLNGAEDNDPHILPGKEYRIKIYRPKKEPADDDNSSYVAGHFPEDYDEINIVVLGLWRPDNLVNEEEVSKLIAREWDKFVHGIREEVTEENK